VAFVSADTSRGPGAESVQEQAVDRSLRRARERAEIRFERIVAAAFSLIGESRGTDFTLQEVAGRAGVSLRTFYQYFNGRDDLLLAVFARGINTTIPLVQREVDKHGSAARQLQAYVETSFRLVFDEERPQSRPLTYYHLRLTQTDPEALGRILAPRNELLLRILRRGVDSGAFRDDIPLPQLIVLLSQTLLAMMHTNVLGTHYAGESPDVANVWRYCLGAVSPPAPDPRA
jgi:AcrR family transcriptional regulator